MTDSRSTAAPRPSLWAEVRDAIRGTGADYTKIPLRRAVFLLAVPMVLELVLESTFAVVDIFFVGKLGSSAVATVGLTESYMFLMYSIAMGLAMGVTAIVARRVGEGKAEEASVTAVQAIWIAILASVPFAIAGIVWARELLQLMGADAWTLEHGVGYMQVALGTNVVVMLLFVINAVFRGAGDAAIAMRVLWLANGLNIVLDPLLIFGIGPFPELGVQGAAVATSIGRGCGVLLQLWVLFRGGRHIRHPRVRRQPAHRQAAVVDAGGHRSERPDHRFPGGLRWRGVRRHLLQGGGERPGFVPGGGHRAGRGDRQAAVEDLHGAVEQRRRRLQQARLLQWQRGVGIQLRRGPEAGAAVHRHREQLQRARRGLHHAAADRVHPARR